MDFASAQTRAMWLHAAYPKAKYAKGQNPVVVSSPEEEDALGHDWYDHPNMTNRPRWVDSSAPKPVVVIESTTSGVRIEKSDSVDSAPSSFEPKPKGSKSQRYSYLDSE